MLTELPDCIDPEIWNQFDEYRKKISKNKWTQLGKELSIRRLTQFHADGFDPNEIIQTTIANGWTGLFASKQSKKTLTEQFNLKQYGKSGKI